jgi:phospholipid/cholesterol/gamma-HCH transport system substrate-binding protein
VPQSAVKVDDVTVGKVTEVELEGYHAKVTLAVRGDVELPDDTEAHLRTTSLLGEKFVSLEAPAGASATSGDRLEDGDVIPLSRSGRNPEVEEVLGAMSLLLNGGGVAQMKTIATELNKAFEGRETDIRSVLAELDTFMGRLDRNKQDIVRAIESLNALAKSVNRQRDSLELALDEMPAALASIDSQRDDLVKMLRALNELSDVGTRVIRQSKNATVASLQSLDPVLTKLAEAGDSLPRAFQVFLTYPFVDEVVGRNPAQARNLHMGDYTNLSVQMDIDLTDGLPPLLEGPLEDVELTCREVMNRLEDELDKARPDDELVQRLLRQAEKLCDATRVDRLLDRLDDRAVELLCEDLDTVTRPLRPLFEGRCDEPRSGGGGGDDDGPLDGVTDGLTGNGSVLRPAPSRVFFGAPSPDAAGERKHPYDPTLGALLVQGMVQR